MQLTVENDLVYFRLQHDCTFRLLATVN